MRVVLKRDLYRVKNGFAAHSRELRLVADGYSPEVAIANLERTALLFLRPFERQGTLKEELQSLGVRAEDDGLDLTIATTH